MTSYVTDAFGNQVSMSLPVAGTGAAGGPTTTSTFDLDGDKVGQIDPLSHQTNWTFDYFGNQISMVLPAQVSGESSSPTTTDTFDLDHQMLSQTDADGNVTSWQFNNDGQTFNETITIPSGSGSATTTEHFGRDLDGNETWLLDFDNRLTTYAFNWYNQEAVEKWYTTSYVGTAYNTIDYNYDTRGETLGGNDSYASGGSGGKNTSLALTYDGPGNVTGEAQMLYGRENAVLSQTWNADGTRASLILELGRVLNSDGTVSGGGTDLRNQYAYDYRMEMTGIEQDNGGGSSGGASYKFVALAYNQDGLTTSVDTYNAATANRDYQVSHEAISYNHDAQPTDLLYLGGTGGAAASWPATTTITTPTATSATSGRTATLPTRPTAPRASRPGPMAAYSYDNDERVSMWDGGAAAAAEAGKRRLLGRLYELGQRRHDATIRSRPTPTEIAIAAARPSRRAIA